MWQEIRPCLLALSIALNVPFVSMWAMRGAPAGSGAARDMTKTSPTPAPGVSGVWNGAHGGYHSGFRITTGQTPLDASLDMYRRIGVTEDQMAVIKPRVARFIGAYSELSKQRQKYSLELVNLVASNADSAAIREKQEQVIECHRQTQEIVVQNMIADMDILTPDQQKALFDSRRRMYDPRGYDKSRGWRAKPSQNPEPITPRPTRGFNESPGAMPDGMLPGSKTAQLSGAGLALPTLALSGWAE